jgi:hypothetical protein
MSTQSHHTAVQDLIRTLDSTRPVIGNDGWEAAATDVIGIHDYDVYPEKYAPATPTRPRTCPFAGVQAAAFWPWTAIRTGASQLC